MKEYVGEAIFKGVDRFSREYDYKYRLLTPGKTYDILGQVNGDKFCMLKNDIGEICWIKSKFFIMTARVAPALKGGCDEEKSSMEAGTNPSCSEK